MTTGQTRGLLALWRQGFSTVGEARQLPDRQLAALPNVGPTTLAALKEVLGSDALGNNELLISVVRQERKQT